MNILFIGPTRIGDTILASSIINFLIDQNNQSKFTIVTSSFSKGLYEKMPNLERIIVINKKKYGLHWLNVWRSCIIKKWDLVVDLRSSITAYLLFTKSRRIFKGNDKYHKIIQFKNFLNTSKKISPFIWHDSNDESESVSKIKTSGPSLAQVTAVSSPTNNTKPSYTFSTNEAGSISYNGSCTSSTTSAIVGNNNIIFNTLSYYIFF